VQIISNNIEKKRASYELILKCATACKYYWQKMNNEMGFSYNPTEYMNTLSSTCCFFNLPFFLGTNKWFITSRNSEFYRQQARCEQHWNKARDESQRIRTE